MTSFLNNVAFAPGDVPFAIYALACIVAIPAIIWLSHFATKERPLRGVPIVTLDGKTPQESWYNNPRELIIKGRKLFPDQPFQILSYSGPKIALPQRYLPEVRDAREAYFQPYVLSDTPLTLPGFDAIHTMSLNQSLIPDVLRVKLTQSLGLITESLVEESIMATEDLFGKLAPGQWHNVTLLPEVTKLVGRLTARTILGEKMAHDPEYVDLTIKHATIVFPATVSFRGWPRYLWPLVQRFTPMCQQAVAQVQRARQLITKELERREEEAKAAIAAGQKVPKTHDSAAWFVDQNKGAAKLDLHLFTALWYIVAYPKYIKLLREEAVSVLKQYGWTRQALSYLTLQDAVHKECLRILRGNVATGRRRTVVGDLKFSDGFTIPKGRSFFVMPPYDYKGENEEFRPERWVEMRAKEGHAKKHAFMASSLEDQEFGVGKHACPGRWFVNDEMKVALCILLLRYDWKAPPGMQMPHFDACEDFPTFRSSVQIQMTPREPEIDISNPMI